jgi:hypothetical protein
VEVASSRCAGIRIETSLLTVDATLFNSISVTSGLMNTLYAV